MKTAPLLALLALISTLVVSCAAFGIPVHRKAHNVSGLTASQVALIKEDGGISIREIDGKKLDRMTTVGGNRDTIEVLPGTHTLLIDASFYSPGGYKYSPNAIPLTFNAEAGHKYLVYGDWSGYPVRWGGPRFKDITNEKK